MVLPLTHSCLCTTMPLNLRAPARVMLKDADSILYLARTPTQFATPALLLPLRLLALELSKHVLHVVGDCLGFGLGILL